MIIVQLHFQNTQLIFTVLLGLPSLQVGMKLTNLVFGACLYWPIHKTCLRSPQTLTPTNLTANFYCLWHSQRGSSSLVLLCSCRVPCTQHMVKNHKGRKLCIVEGTQLPKYSQELTHSWWYPQGTYGSGAPRDTLYKAKSTENKLQTNWSY